MSNKKQLLRRKRMRRQSRLQSAKHWVTTYTGKNIIKGYCTWFGVNLLCAAIELKMLGMRLDEQHLSQALQIKERMIKVRQANKKREEDKKCELDDLLSDSDENFYFIAEYTRGCSYGITQGEPTELQIAYEPLYEGK